MDYEHRRDMWEEGEGKGEGFLARIGGPSQTVKPSIHPSTFTKTDRKFR